MTTSTTLSPTERIAKKSEWIMRPIYDRYGMNSLLCAMAVRPKSTGVEMLIVQGELLFLMDARDGMSEPASVHVTGYGPCRVRLIVHSREATEDEHSREATEEEAAIIARRFEAAVDLLHDTLQRRVGARS